VRAPPSAAIALARSIDRPRRARDRLGTYLAIDRSLNCKLWPLAATGTRTLFPFIRGTSAGDNFAIIGLNIIILVAALIT